MHRVMDNENQANSSAGRGDYNYVVNVLSNMFGVVMDRNAIFAIVESCEGDLNSSIEAITQIVDDCGSQNIVNSNTDQESVPNIEVVSQQNTITVLNPINTNIEPTSPNKGQPNMSNHQQNMAASSQPITSTGTVPKKSREPPTSYKKINDYQFWTEQIKRILYYHNKGYSTLIIMRGVPGSGKTWLARKIIESLLPPFEENFFRHICSSDDYFLFQGKYYYDRNKLSEAHSSNLQKVRTLLSDGVSPIIVDNTNTQLWEMEPYMVHAVKEGYYIEIVEPKNPWSKKANLLARKNLHNVHIVSIKRQLDRYEPHHSTEHCLKLFRIAYPPNKTPPVLRKSPTFKVNTKTSEKIVIIEPEIQNIEVSNEPASIINNDTDVHQESNNSDEYIARKLEELEKVAEQWERGKKSKEVDDSNDKQEYEQENATGGPQPPTCVENTLHNINQVEDWKSFTRFMPVWDNQPPPMCSKQSKKTMSYKSIATSVDFGDADLNIAKNKFKVVLGKCRDINFYHIPQIEKIPDQRMLDKGTTTNKQMIVEPSRCKNEEKHFKAFRKMFKNIPRADLRDIFEKCHGDVNWAVEIVLDGVASNEINITDNDMSDIDDGDDEQCECADAAYEIIPNVITEQEPTPNTHQTEPKEEPSIPKPQTKRKIKKESAASDTMMLLKKQVEQNIAIADKHYSDHCLKIRKMRRGEIDDEVTENDGETENATGGEQEQSPEVDDFDNESDSSHEKTVNMILGKEFMLKLDEMYDRKDIVYPDSIAYMVNMPMSTLNEINALWMESLSYQLECQESLSDILLKEDEALAKALEEAEAETEKQGIESEVPDFKEIMDLDFALSIHHKEITEEMRLKEPNDMAANLTRIKLNNLFPDIEPDVLSELLMAHDNNFQATVEVLLMSTGKGDILEKKNGLNKFVMEKEIARQEQCLREHQNALTEEEWPVLSETTNVDMATVENYRTEAQMHLDRRNKFHLKAQSTMHRGFFQLAGYYSEMAAYHKKQFDRNNSLAATSLIQLNSKSQSFTTLDLHYLHVAEAIVTLDIFIDFHIHECRREQNKSVQLFLITGRGLHSKGGPRIKPAVQNRLRKRRLTQTKQLNPGLVAVTINAESKISSELNQE